MIQPGLVLLIFIDVTTSTHAMDGFQERESVPWVSPLWRLKGP
jgi:hypothetical protein